MAFCTELRPRVHCERVFCPLGLGCGSVNIREPDIARQVQRDFFCDSRCP